MQKMTRLAGGWILALALTVVAAPGHAQGKSKHEDKPRSAEVQREDKDRRDLRRSTLRQWDERGTYENRDRDERRGKDKNKAKADRRRNVPPGWCIGKGNPHNTPENCGRYNAPRRDDRSDPRDGRYNRDGQNRTYQQAHATFHLKHDRACRERAAQRPLDVRWQIQVRTDCKAAHDRWHTRAGVRHEADRRW